MDEEEPIGVIYPLPPDVITQILSGKRDIFVKYISRVPTKKSKHRLKNGLKLFIYASGGSKSIVATSYVKKVEFLPAPVLMKKYAGRVAIQKDYAKEYFKGREDKALAVLHLSNVTPVFPPIKILTPITMSGQFITQENKKLLFAQHIDL